MFQEHEKKRGESFGDPLDLDNQITTLPSGPDVKQNENASSYGAITNGDPKPASPEGTVLWPSCILFGLKLNVLH